MPTKFEKHKEHSKTTMHNSVGPKDSGLFNAEGLEVRNR